MQKLSTLVLTPLALLTGLGGTLLAAQEASEMTHLEREAVAFVEQLDHREFAAAATRFDSTMSAVMPAGKLEETWDQVEGQVGSYLEWSRTTEGKVQGYDFVLVTTVFENATLDIRVVFDADQLIAGLFFQPGSAPDEAEPVLPEGLREREIVVGDGQWALPGTLTLPAGAGPFPAVVLVHGSGPNDRDESVGANKPFRDLAWGLAGQGIVVLRYEKRTRHYRDRLMKDSSGLTVSDESVDDAVAAVARLREIDAVDARRIVVLGHSLGGMLAPRIGAADPAVAGLVVLAGATRPLHELILDQVRYLAELDSVVSGSERARLEQIEQETARLLMLTEADSLSTERILGAHPGYWLDLASYDPIAVAGGLTMPMLILHAGRDYQVTEADFVRWQTAFGNDARVTLKVYPALNHLFIAGEGPSQPAEYNVAGRVAGEVIDDVAGWISALPPSNF